MARKGIRSCKMGTRDVGQTEVKVCEVKEPLGRTEEHEVLMISEDLDRKWGTMQVVAPSLESVNNSQEFLIVDIIITFGGREGLEEVGAWMPVAISICLEKDSA